MPRLAIVLAGAAIAAAAACSASLSTVDDAGSPLVVTRLRPEPLAYAYSSGLTNPGRLVIRDEATWSATWSQIWATHGEVPPLPAVSFSSEMIVVAALGTRPSGGYGIFVDAASETPSRVTVKVRSVSPGATCGTTAALTQPVDIARMPRRDVPVVFAETSVVNQC